ncbi:hypothetical protein MCHI_003343 [Candidatus Magnetoovum chiemensis]|nr:hypothetical protein MCHI_003343 [Candidatus Magnetoovum chiemensis]
MTTSVDTLTIFERLKNADLNEKAAKEITEIFKDLLEERVVSKKDLQEALAVTSAEMKVEIEKIRAVVEKTSAEIRAETKTEIEKIRAAVEKTGAETKTEIEKIRAETKREIEKTRADLDAKIEKTRSDLELKLETVKSDLIRWVAGMLIAQGAVIATLVKLL